MYRYVIILLIVWTSLLCYSQNIWESANISDKDWQSVGNLITNKYGNCIEIKNGRPIESYSYGWSKAKMNRMMTNHPYVLLNNVPSAQSFDLTFDVNNRTIPPNIQGDYSAFWFVDVEYVGNGGLLKSEKHWVARTSGNDCCEYTYETSGTYADLNNVYDGGVKPTRTVRVIFQNNELAIYIDTKNVASIDNVSSIGSIKVHVSAGTTVIIKNTKVNIMTKYGQSVPFLQKAANYLDAGNVSSAATEMTEAISKGLICYETYLMRGIAYYLQGYYKSAIEDFSCAINTQASNKELAYYYRGLSRLALDDDYGINDLKNGGQDGIVFLRENNLMNYSPGQRRDKSTKQRRTTISSPKKPALKKQ